MTEQIDWRTKQLSQVARVWEDRNVEELETLPEGTKPVASYHRSYGRKRHKQWKGSPIFTGRAREGHRQSDEH